MRVEVRLFGGIGASSGGIVLDLGGPKQRLIFASLAVELGSVVPLGRTIDIVWGDGPPERAEVSVRGYVSNLRRMLVRHEPDVVLQWRDLGYVLSGPIDVDVIEFERLVERGRTDATAGRLLEAKAGLTAALDLWNGPPLGAHAGAIGLHEAVARWGELRGDAIERLFDVRLDLGEHRDAVAGIRSATVEYPFREHLRVQLAMALYRSDRPVDALRSIQTARRTLIDEVGVDPGPELRSLETRIHAEDPLLDWIEPPFDVGQPHVVAGDPPGQPPPLWGRSTELASLQAVLDAVRRGQPDGGRGRAIIVGGEPGIGKTAIAERLAGVARLEGFDVAWARCRESAVAAPYWPWHALANELESTSTAGEVGAELVSVLDAVTNARGDAPAPPPPQLVTHSAAHHAFTRLTSPCLVVIDDLQWADAASLSLLEFIAGDLADLQLVVVATVRSPVAPMVGDCLAELSRSAGSRRVELEGLDHAAVDEWIRDVLGPTASRDVATLIRDRTEGNPFFVREVATLLATSAAERPVELIAARDLPVAVHDVVRRRTSRLDPQTQQLLIVASVIGRDFETDLLAQVATTSHDHVMQLLEPAVDAGLIIVHMSRPGVASFSHAIVADALAAELNPIRRARTHLDIVHAIEAKRGGRPEAALAQLAHHAFAGATAGGAAAALDYSLSAARSASDAHAAQDAVTHLERALALLDLACPNDDRRRVTVLTDLGLAQCAAADVGGGRSTLLAAATVAEQVGDNPAVVRALAVMNADDLWTSLDWGQHDPAAIAIIERTLDVLPVADHTGRASLLGALAGQTYHLDPARSSAAAADAVAAAELVGDGALLFRVLLQQYWAEWRPGANAVRTTIADRMLDLVAHAPLAPGAASLAHLARFTTAYELGDGEASDHHLHLARESADPVRTPAAWSYVLYAQVSMQLLRGELDDADRTIDDLYTALRRSRRFVAETTRAGLRMQLRVEQGRTDDALAEATVLDSSIYASPIAWFRAWALAEGGRLDEADRSLAGFGGDVADDWFTVPLLTAGVSAAATSGNVEFLRNHLDDLLPFAQLLACTGSGGIVVGPVALAIARAIRALGDEASSAVHLETAHDMIERMGATPWATRLRAAHRLT